MNLADGDGERRRPRSAPFLALAGLLVVVGVYLFVKGTPTEIAAAAIEDGYRPPTYNFKRSGSLTRHYYRIVGRLVDTAPVSFDNRGGSWLCAPLSSGRAEAATQTQVFYAAAETAFRRARAENRFPGELHCASTAFLRKPTYEATACGVPDDSYVLIDDGSLLAYRTTGRALLIAAGAFGCLAAVAFFIEARRNRADPSP